MIANGLWCHIFEINNYLILLVKKPGVDTNKNQKKRNHTKKKNDKEKQSTLLQIKTNIVKMKIRDIQRGCSKRDEEFINSMRQAEKKE